MVFAPGGRNGSRTNRSSTRESGPLIVMPRFARRLLIASLVAFHAAVMLCGPCLHGLPGWGHSAGLSRGADAHRVSDHVQAVHVQPDNCPVCHLFSQGQLPIDLASAPAVLQTCALKPEARSDPVTPALLHPTSP